MSDWDDFSESHAVNVESSTESSSETKEASFAHSSQYSRTMESPSAYVPSQQEFQFVNVPPSSPAGTSPSGEILIHSLFDLLLNFTEPFLSSFAFIILNSINLSSPSELGTRLQLVQVALKTP